MSNEKNKSSSSSPPTKRVKMSKNCPGVKIYTASKAEYKSLVLSLTCTHRRSPGQTSLRFPTLAQPSNPQPIRINDASIPPGSSGQTSLRVTSQAHVSNPHAPILPVSSGQIRLLFSTQAHVINPPSLGLFDPPNPNPAAQWSSASSSWSLPFPSPPSSVWSRTSAAGPSDADQASSSRPFPRSPPVPSSVPTMLPTSPSSSRPTPPPPVPSSVPTMLPTSPSSSRPTPPPPVPSSVPTMLPTSPSSSRPSPPPPVPSSVPKMLLMSPSSSRWSPPSVPLVSARLPENPPSLPAAAPVPPSLPREQGAREPLFDDLENFLIDDDDYNFAAWSPLPYVTGTSNGEHQTENVAAPVLTNQPSGSLHAPVPQNGSMIPLGHGSNSMHENVAPPVHATSPSGIAPPVHATLPYENSSIWSSSQNGLGSSNVPPSVAPSMDLLNGPNYQHMSSQGITPSVHATLPYENSSTWSNSQNGLGSSNIPPSVAPSMDLLNEPNYQHMLSQGIAPPVHTTLPYENSSTWSSFQNGLGSSNVPPSVAPSMDLLNGSNYQHMLSQGIAPPVHSTSPYENSSTWSSFQNGLGSNNVPLSVAPSMDLPNGPNYQHMLSQGIAPPVHATLPSENLSTWSSSQNGLESSNVPPAIAPSMDLPNRSNYQHMLSQGIAPPVHATLPSENLSTWSNSQNGLGSSNVPPAVAPSGPDHSNDQQGGNALPATSLPSESQLGWPNPQNGLRQGTVPTNVHVGSSYLSNYSHEEMEACLAQIGFGKVPSWHRNWHSYPRTLLPSTNSPSSSSAPANLPPGNLQG